MKKIDMLTHILPREFYERMIKLDLKPRGINKRVRQAEGIVNLDDRFRVMDLFGDYVQIINLVVPRSNRSGPRLFRMLWRGSRNH